VYCVTKIILEKKKLLKTHENYLLVYNLGPPVLSDFKGCYQLFQALPLQNITCLLNVCFYFYHQNFFNLWIFRHSIKPISLL